MATYHHIKQDSFIVDTICTYYEYHEVGAGRSDTNILFLTAVIESTFTVNRLSWIIIHSDHCILITKFVFDAYKYQ
jgi:hypothetical protein